MNNNIQDFTEILTNFNPFIRTALIKIPDKIKNNIQEICIRINSSIIIFTQNNSYFVGKNGEVASEDPKNLVISQSDILETMKILCNFSIYSYQNQIKEGFITLKGGHRAGFSGTAVINNNEIINISDISSINFRISREILGCSDRIFNKFGLDVGGTLIIGPPSSGKTTILRDMARKLSTSFEENKLIKVSIIDERREIAASYQGVPQRDIGFSDVLTGFPKAEGIIRAIRTLSPRIIICDEIGNNEDAEAIKKSLNSGVGIIASIHAKSPDEMANSFRIKNILSSGAIKRAILLDSTPGKIKGMFEVSK
ncbi:MAG: Flp pilus assembly complex ATPase component TadA [Clostridia bacterium]|nr:Flp pilus assembly complex ATPase component TadA [Clostridia bacterium]